MQLCRLQLCPQWDQSSWLTWCLSSWLTWCLFGSSQLAMPTQPHVEKGLRECFCCCWSSVPQRFGCALQEPRSAVLGSPQLFCPAQLCAPAAPWGTSPLLPGSWGLLRTVCHCCLCPRNTFKVRNFPELRGRARSRSWEQSRARSDWQGGRAGIKHPAAAPRLHFAVAASPRIESECLLLKAPPSSARRDAQGLTCIGHLGSLAPPCPEAGDALPGVLPCGEWQGEGEEEQEGTHSRA